MTPSNEIVSTTAKVRRLCGQAALYRLVDGHHEILLCGHVYVGATIDEAIEAARNSREVQG